MYAVIEDGSQQFRVSEGDVVEVALRELAPEAKEIQFGRVLLLSGDGNIRVGTPLVDGAKVTAEVLDPEMLGPKTQSFDWRRRKHSRRKTGHRQKYVQVKITKIVA